MQNYETLYYFVTGLLALYIANKVHEMLRGSDLNRLRRSLAATNFSMLAESADSIEMCLAFPERLRPLINSSYDFGPGVSGFLSEMPLNRREEYSRIVFALYSRLPNIIPNAPSVTLSNFYDLEAKPNMPRQVNKRPFQKTPWFIAGTSEELFKKIFVPELIGLLNGLANGRKHRIFILQLELGRFLSLIIINSPEKASDFTHVVEQFLKIKTYIEAHCT